MAASFLGLATIMCLAIIPAEIFLDRDANIDGALLSRLMVAAMNFVLAFVVINASRNQPGLIVVAVVAAGLNLFALDGAVSLAASHPRASALVPIPFWVVVAADAIATVATIVAAIRAPKTGSVSPV